ncbi:hypothetical protein HMH01_15145 [Halovulum dunhuangense]|uniref:Uncharacterized protein n=1 Tax=Halovulum dunhuangense TaxID=1505036 RepID=A0A849L5V1_9RHOB|nr:DUF6064 family protein [Halovulum dunhuangense]NNU81775.1 hypothetical protein [Halovulum dunhuangense]
METHHTPTSHSVQEEIEWRYLAFANCFGNDAFFDGALITSLQQISRICAVYFGEETAKAGIEAMVGRYYPQPVAEGGWELALEMHYSGFYPELPAGDLFHRVEAYAKFGILLTPARDVETREQILRRDVGMVERFLAAIPLEAWGIENEHAVKLVRKASARLKLDLGEPVSAEDLSLLSGFALQSIKDRMVGQFAEIPAEAALAWLSTHWGFRPSLWRQQDAIATLDVLENYMEDAIFIPVATDGSSFRPYEQIDDYYHVGAEGHEYRFGVAPCPTTIFTIAMLLMGSWRAVRWLLTLPGLWAAVGGSAAILLGVPQDFALLAALLLLLLFAVARFAGLGFSRHAGSVG